MMNERTQRKTIDNLWSAIDWARDAAHEITQLRTDYLSIKDGYETPEEEKEIAEAIIVLANRLKEQIGVIQNLPGGGMNNEAQ